MTLKICMFVYNNCRHDSRVLKEAATLAQAGHQVRIVALLDDHSLSYEERDGFTIIRIPKKPLHWRIIQKIHNWHPFDSVCRFAGLIGKAFFCLIKWTIGLLFWPVKIFMGLAPLRTENLRWTTGFNSVHYHKDRMSKKRWSDKRLTHRSLKIVWICYIVIKKAFVFVPRKVLRLCRSAIKKSVMAFHRPLCFWDYYCRSFPVIRSEPADIYHAHDLNTLPLAYWLKKRTGGYLVYDSHEFYVERNRANKPSRIRKYLLKKIEGFFVKSSDHVITVSDSIGIELQKRYDVKQLTIVLNAPPLNAASNDHTENKCSLRNELGIAENDRIVLYVGNISLNRGLESLIRCLAHLNHCVLVMMGKVTEDYAEKLKQVAADAGVSDRICFFGPVQQEQVIAYASSADVGAAPILNACLSYYYCLPNKLFECMNAGLPTVGSNFPELKKVIEGYEIGKTFNPENPEEIAAAINYILSDRQRYDTMRHNSMQAAKIFNWDNESKKLLTIYDELGNQLLQKNQDWVLADEAN